MNNLAYTSQDATVVGAKVEEKVREEIGGDAAIPYTVEPGDASTRTVGTVLSDIGGALLGGSENTLFHLNFAFSRPRAANLQVSMNRQGVGCHAGLLLYSAQFAKPIGAEVALEDPKFFGKSKFTGDPAISGKLNANGDLIKRVNNFARVESQSGGLTLKIKRCCKIVPQNGGALLVIASLPRPIKMGFSATVDAKEFFDIAGMVEAAL